MLTKKIRDFYNRHRFVRALDAIVKSAVVLSGPVIADVALEMFVSSKPVYAQEIKSRKNLAEVKKPKNVLKPSNLSYQHKYQNLIQASLDPENFKNLNDLFHKVKKRVNPGKKHTKKQAIQVLDEITIFLMREKTQIPRNLRCHYYSSFCLAAGEYAGLDLEPFFIPTRGYKQAHMLLRCATSDNELFLYDPAFGGEKDIVFYQKYFNLAECNAYPKVLNEEEFDAAQLSNIGVTWHNKGKYEKAAEFYVQALESDPDYAPAHNNLGVAYAKLGRYDEAIACYKEALNIDSDYSAALNNLAIAFYRMSKFDQAIEFFDKAIKANPKNTGAYNNKGLMLQKIGRKKEAFECFSRVVELKQKIK
ncbi:hypothetical protein AYK26_05850 [Euryarchaeota archaeon SM23-78]|nr:MAG: hypothetical protein AYK26_05850 [Euryarchaeota archaeon SM23-78]MBW3001012.1 tetratricopeptide repeat protein [Candidatus Woesearchaeota archaeon]